MKNYPKYGNPGFLMEYLYLLERPKTSADAYRQLCCLGELARSGPHARDERFQEIKMSKRRLRVLRTYWALYRKETNT